MLRHLPPSLAPIVLICLLLPSSVLGRDFLVEPVSEPTSPYPILDSGRWVHNAVLPSGEYVVGFVREVQGDERIFWEVVSADAHRTNVAGLAFFDEGSYVNVGLDEIGRQTVFYQDGLAAAGHALAGYVLRSAISHSWDGLWYPEDVDIDLGGYGSAQYPAAVGSSWNRWVTYFACGIYGEGSASLYAARPSTGPYETELVDSNVELFRDRGRISSVDVGPFHAPGIAYVKYSGTILYAERDGSSWTQEVVFHDQGLRVGHVDLDIDGGGVPHVSFYLIDSQDLMYATRGSDGTWSAETAAFNGRVGKWSSIAVDPAGVPHIACRRDTDQALVLVSPAPGDTWDAEIVDTDGSVGEYASLAIDAYGGLHLAYRDATNQRAKRAWWLDTNVNGIHDATDIANGLLTDCDGNGIADDQEILFGYADDCNSNGIPDKCEEDCDGDGTLDSCQIAADPSLDCDGNGTLDACDVATGAIDCDGDGVLDACEIAAGAADCDGNGALDSCQIGSGSGDCDANGVLDLCEASSGQDIAGTGDYFDFPQRAGEFVAGGDVNGDGHADLIFSERDEIHVHLGGPDFDGVADRSISTGADGLFVGDVDGDGLDDLLLTDFGRFYEESEFILYRGDAASILVEEATIVSPEEDVQFGAAFALADVDGDGSRELVVGAPEGDDFSPPGRVFVFSTDPLDAAPEQTWIPDALNSDDFGRTLINAGDLDGDGLDDVVVGEPGNTGQAFVYFSRPGGPSVAGPVINPTDTLTRFASALAPAGDVNGDGFDDFYVGDPNQYFVDRAEGRVLLYHGGNPMDGYRDRVYVDRVDGTSMGTALASGGDLDGDSFDDLLIGFAEGHYGDHGVVEVHLGGPAGDTVADLRLAGLESEDATGTAVAILGDVNDDGVVDFAYGAPGEGEHGMVRVRSLVLPAFADCDGNGVRDACDIAAGAPDQNADGIPDVCQTVTMAPEVEKPRVSRIVGAHPIPFNPRTTIVFEVASAGPVDLTVYDAAGRRVDTLLRGPVDAGRHEVVWDATGGSSALASGVYYATLRAGSVRSVQKLVLVR